MYAVSNCIRNVTLLKRQISGYFAQIAPHYVLYIDMRGHKLTYYNIYVMPAIYLAATSTVWVIYVSSKNNFKSKGLNSRKRKTDARHVLSLKGTGLNTSINCRLDNLNAAKHEIYSEK